MGCLLLVLVVLATLEIENQHTNTDNTWIHCGPIVGPVMLHINGPVVGPIISGPVMSLIIGSFMGPVPVIGPLMGPVMGAFIGPFMSFIRIPAVGPVIGNR